MPRGTAARALNGLIAAVVLAGCASSPGSGDAVTLPPGATTGSPADGAAATTGTGADEASLEAGTARQIWLDFWDAASAPDPAAAVGGLDGQLTDLTRATLGRLPPEMAGARLSQAPLVSGTGPFAFEDCIATVSTSGPTAGLLFTGEVGGDAGGWTLSVDGPGPPCAPATVADEAVDAYLEFIEIDQGWWDPPDPDDPAIAQRTTGRHRQHLETVLADLRQQGAHAVLYSPEVQRYPEVTAWFPDRIEVRDCYDRFDGLGVFDAAGNPLSGYPAGGSVLDELTFQREDDRWKVSEITSNVGVECVRRPSGEAVRLVGPPG